MITELCSAGRFFPQPVEKGGLDLSQMGLLLARPFSESPSAQHKREIWTHDRGESV